MSYSNEELLQKATLTSHDFGGAGNAPLSVEQVKEFIVLFSAGQSILPNVRTVTSRAAKWEEGIIDFGGRITRPGVQGARLPDQERAKPLTGNVELSTSLLRAEVPVSDESLEDNVGEEEFANNLEDLIADQFGFDVEELLLTGDTDSTDEYLALLDGWLKQVQGPDGHVVNATAEGKDYQNIFKKLLQSIPNRHKRRLQVDGKFIVPVTLEEEYRDILSDRGTPLGDLRLEGTGTLRYQGIEILSSASMPIDDDEKCQILLTNRNNLYAGYRRAMTLETFRDPREGATSFIVTARVAAAVAIPDATAIATNVDVSI